MTTDLDIVKQRAEAGLLAILGDDKNVPLAMVALETMVAAMAHTATGDYGEAHAFIDMVLAPGAHIVLESHEAAGGAEGAQ